MKHEEKGTTPDVHKAQRIRDNLQKILHEWSPKNHFRTEALRVYKKIISFQEDMSEENQFFLATDIIWRACGKKNRAWVTKQLRAMRIASETNPSLPDLQQLDKLNRRGYSLLDLFKEAKEKQQERKFYSGE